jgi:hypothetical protein
MKCRNTKEALRSHSGNFNTNFFPFRSMTIHESILGLCIEVLFDDRIRHTVISQTETGETQSPLFSNNDVPISIVLT